ncbi:MAG TPA: glycosyltransferase [Treponemataceae bacterium]|nr:glycosyltransferase [Treponemataceae bacterium]
MINITILTFVDRISCFYSLSPFLQNSNPFYKFTFTDDPQFCLLKDKNKILILMRQFIKPDLVDIGLMKALREKYDRIAFFHDDAGGGIPRLEVLPFVDLFYSKALFKDTSLYSRDLYGKELYSDYYHTKYGITDEDNKKRAVISDPYELAKLRLSWNIGIGDYPRYPFRQRAGVALSRVLSPRMARLFYLRDTFEPEQAIASNTGQFAVHARLGIISRPSITYQRKLILEKIADNPLFLTGSVPQKQFNREAAHSKIVLSPFGWGELCLRDFEAVRCGALLLKPDMSHIETWPNVFIPEETYVPFNWDATDLISTVESLLADESKIKKIVRTAAFKYREDLNSMPKRFNSTLEEIIS